MAARAKREFPGTAKPRRFVPRLHYELLVCGLRGHEFIGTDTAHLDPADDVLAREINGVRWYRCLRCDSWLPLGHPAAPTRQHLPPRDEIKLPIRGRPLRDKIVLRLIAVDRALHFLLLVLLSVAVFAFASDRSNLRDTFYRVVADLQGAVAGGPVQTDRTGIVHELDRIFTLKAGTLHAIGIALAVYALLEGVEAVGLWTQRRWAEYLTLVVTASLLPLEIYEFVKRQSPFKVSALIINIAIVIYLLYAKRLFGIRGGAKAEEEAREADVGWHALEANAPESAPAT